MNYVVFLLTLWIFIRTANFGLFEIKENKNKLGGVSVIVVSVIGFVLPNAMLYFK